MPEGNWTFETSPDDRFLLTAEADETMKIWDVANLDRPVEVGVLPAGFNGVFSPDSRTLVDVRKKEVVVIDSATGTARGRIELPTQENRNPIFSPDSSLVAIETHEQDGPGAVTILDLATCSTLWTHPIKVTRWSSVDFTLDGEIVVLSRPDDKGEAFDLRGARPGELRASFPMRGRALGPNLNETRRRAMLVEDLDDPGRPAADGSWLRMKIEEWFANNLKQKRTHLIRVIDLRAALEVFHLEVADPERLLLSSDGTALIATFRDDPESQHACCYDVPARHPWLKIVGIPAGCGVAYLLLSAWWRRRGQPTETDRRGLGAPFVA